MMVSRVTYRVAVHDDPLPTEHLAFALGTSKRLPIVLAAILSVLHSLATAQAASTLFKQLKVPDDEAAFTATVDSDRWHTVRAVLQVVTLLAVLWALWALFAAG